MVLKVHRCSLSDLNRHIRSNNLQRMVKDMNIACRVMVSQHCSNLVTGERAGVGSTAFHLQDGNSKSWL